MKPFFSFGYAFFLKVVIPGSVAAFILNPLMVSIAIKLDFEAKLGNSLQIVLLGIVLGLLTSFNDDIIYKIFEGYYLWPVRLRDYFTNRLNKKVKARFDRYQKAEDEIERKMRWSWLEKFPIREERVKTETEAVLPTELGNILYAYEDYPESRYGLEPVFFWPRLWLVLDKDTRREINIISAEADCVTYVSFVFLFVSILYFLAFICHLFNIPTLILGPMGKPIDSLSIGVVAFCPYFFLGLALSSFFLFYVFYRLSLPLHVRFGTFFGSLFDIHRDKIEKMLSIKEYQKNSWEETFNYLKFQVKKCSKCNKYFPLNKDKCPHCEM